jgi:hypothetical protein
MLNTTLPDLIPMWAVYPFCVAIFLLVLEVGYRVAKRMQKRNPDATDSGVGPLLGSTFALMAFLLGFVVAFGMGIYNERRQLVVKDANALTTAYLRAGLMNEPYRSQVRGLLHEVVDLRLDAVTGGGDRSKAASNAARAVQIGPQLWAIGEAQARDNPPPTMAIFFSSLNDVLSAQAERLQAVLEMRIPPFLTVSLLAVAALTLFLIGLQSGYAPRRNMLPLVFLTLIIAMVFYLIVDIDRPQEGFIRVSQKPMVNLQQLLSTLP